MSSPFDDLKESRDSTDQAQTAVGVPVTVRSCSIARLLSCVFHTRHTMPIHSTYGSSTPRQCSSRTSPSISSKLYRRFIVGDDSMDASGSSSNLSATSSCSEPSSDDDDSDFMTLAETYVHPSYDI